jgi:hypothetical protein
MNPKNLKKNMMVHRCIHLHCIHNIVAAKFLELERCVYIQVILSFVFFIFDEIKCVKDGYY